MKPTKRQIQDSFNAFAPDTIKTADLPKFLTDKPRERKKDENGNPVKNERPEDDLQIKICNEVMRKLPNTLWWATPNNTYVGKMTGAKLGYLKKLKEMGVRAGVSDLLALFRNVNGDMTFVCAELKVKPNKPTPEQKEFLWEAFGYGAVVGDIYSVEEMVALLKKAGHPACF